MLGSTGVCVLSAEFHNPGFFFFFFKQKTAYEIASCLVGSDLSGGDSALLGESCFDVADIARLVRAGSAAVPIGVVCF